MKYYDQNIMHLRQNMEATNPTSIMLTEDFHSVYKLHERMEQYKFLHTVLGFPF
jgi:hypothetical protein